MPEAVCSWVCYKQNARCNTGPCQQYLTSGGNALDQHAVSEGLQVTDNGLREGKARRGSGVVPAMGFELGMT